jgi:hypothetical protein
METQIEILTSAPTQLRLNLIKLRLLETQEEQDRWLLESREAIDAQIRRGIDQLDRGEGIPEDRVDEYLSRLKLRPE